jgi:hypothetical protein
MTRKQIASVDEDGRVSLPRDWIRQDRVRPSERFEVHRLGVADYRIVRCFQLNLGLTDWLLACPVKGYFRPIKSDSTESL